MTRWRGRKIFTREAVMLMRRMLKDGATNEEIAAAVGSTPGSVAARCAQLNIRKSRAADGFLGAQVGVSCVAAFVSEAGKRGMKPAQLAGRVLKQVATDNLFAAVLDV